MINISEGVAYNKEELAIKHKNFIDELEGKGFSKRRDQLLKTSEPLSQIELFWANAFSGPTTRFI